LKLRLGVPSDIASTQATAQVMDVGALEIVQSVWSNSRGYTLKIMTNTWCHST
jgi:hypothetical protein